MVIRYKRQKSYDDKSIEEIMCATRLNVYYTFNLNVDGIVTLYHTTLYFYLIKNFYLETADINSQAVTQNE